MDKQVANIETKVVAEPINITSEDIKNLFCPLATAKEVALGLGIVKSLNLNPFLREVYFIKYSQNDKMQIVVGYEVYIKRAERTGLLKGWKAGIKKDDGVAWVEIKRADWDEPFYWEVALSEFDKKQSTWKQIPTFMAKKVAIAQGFRLCFSTELSGMPYTSDEVTAFNIGATKQVTSSKPEVAMPEEVEEIKEEVLPEETETAVEEEPEIKKTTEVDDVTSKKNLTLVRDTMAKCKTLDELKTLWQQEMKGYQDKFTPSDYDKATNSKEYFKKLLVNREKAQANGK